MRIEKPVIIVAMVVAFTTDLPFLRTKKLRYKLLDLNFLRSETSFFLVSTLTPLNGIASGRVIPAFSNSNIVEERGCGIC